MRRKERECNSPEFLHGVLDSAEVLHIAFQTGDFPYVIPVNFVVYEGALCVHCALEGTKTELIAADGRVGFTLYTDVSIDTAKATTRYRSVCGYGRAEMVEDITEKQAILAALAHKYMSDCTLPVPAKTAMKTGVFRVVIEGMTGKNNPAS